MTGNQSNYKSGKMGNNSNDQKLWGILGHSVDGFKEMDCRVEHILTRTHSKKKRSPAASWTLQAYILGCPFWLSAWTPRRIRHLPARRQVCNLTRKLPHGFEDAITFTDSTALFGGLWEELLNTKLYLLAKGTPMLEKGCTGILEAWQTGFVFRNIKVYGMEQDSLMQ